MLAVDGVELVFGHHPHQVGELDSDRAVRRQDVADAGHEVVGVRHLSHNLASHHQVGPDALTAQLLRAVRPEEHDPGGDPLRLGHPAGGLHAEDRDPAVGEALQQVAVVAAELHRERVRAQVKVGDPLRVLLGVAEPRVGEGREVAVARAKMPSGSTYSSTWTSQHRPQACTCRG